MTDTDSPESPPLPIEHAAVPAPAAAPTPEPAALPAPAALPEPAAVALPEPAAVALPVAFPPPPPPDADAWRKPQRQKRPLLGVSLWGFGALLWAYVVVGEIVVWTAVPELLGVFAVLAALGLAWHRGTSQMPRSPRWRLVLPGVIATFLWLFTLVLSTAAFSTGQRSKAEMASLMLWFFAAAAYALGRHLTALDKMPLTVRARAGRIGLWIVVALATLLSGVNIIDHS